MSSKTEWFSVGEYLRDELNARGIVEADFARQIGWPEHVVIGILHRDICITDEQADQIGAYLGTSGKMWRRLRDARLAWLMEVMGGSDQ